MLSILEEKKFEFFLDKNSFHSNPFFSQSSWIRIQYATYLIAPLRYLAS